MRYASSKLRIRASSGRFVRSASPEVGVQFAQQIELRALLVAGHPFVTQIRDRPLGSAAT